MLLRQFNPGFGSTSRGIAQTKSLLLPLVVRHLPFACRALRPEEAGSADPRVHSHGHIQPKAGYAVLHEFGRAPMVAADNRPAKGHRFQENNSESFLAAGHDESATSRITFFQIVQ